MTGIADYNFPTFFKAEKMLETVGYGVINPARNLPANGTGTREEYMTQDITSILKSDGIALMDGHFYSPGCRTEIDIALNVGLTIARVDWWVSNYSSTNSWHLSQS